MIVGAVIASTLGQIFQPLFQALAWLIALFYALIPNYAVAIALLTVVVMIVTAPLTVKSTKSMVSMQRLAPEMKKLQAKYKGDKQTLNEEMMKLYREHGVNPMGGCLPMFIQFPIFFVLYAVIRGLTYTVKAGHYFRNTHGVLQLCTHGTCASPQYIGYNTGLYRNLRFHNGKMPAFGIDLASKVLGHHTFAQALPYAFLILIAIGLQYLQMRQLNSRNPQMAQANPQAQMMQRYMPILFAVIYINIAAGVNIYFIVSSLCRIGIQEAVFRSGIISSPSKEEVLPSRSAKPPARKKTLMERVAEAQKRALEQQEQQRSGGSRTTGSRLDSPRTGRSGPAGSTPSRANQKGPGASTPRKQAPSRTPPNSPAKPSAQGGTGSGNGKAGNTNAGKAGTNGRGSPNGPGADGDGQSQSKAKRGKRGR